MRQLALDQLITDFVVVVVLLHFFLPFLIEIFLSENNIDVDEIQTGVLFNESQVCDHKSHLDLVTVRDTSKTSKT